MASIGIGTKLSIETVTPGTFTDIAGLDSLSWSGFELGMVDATDFDTADSGEKPIAGLIKWGEVSFEGNFNGDASQQGVYTQMLTRAVKNFKVTFPTTVTAAFDTMTLAGYVTKFAVTSPTKDKMRLSGTIVLSAKPTWA